MDVFGRQILLQLHIPLRIASISIMNLKIEFSMEKVLFKLGLVYNWW